MPPELYDVDEDRWQTGEGQTSTLRFFADEVSHGRDANTSVSC
jgi:hypothetical protein